jgi:hypothetical protein
MTYSASLMSRQRVLIICALVLFVAVIILLVWSFRYRCACKVLLASTQANRANKAAPATANFVDLPPSHARLTTPGAAFILRRFQVDEGSEAAARKYYREAVSPQIAFLTPQQIENSSLRDLLIYFGYPNLSPVDLHRLSSEDLMALSPGDILATRFFAPKITAVSAKPTEIPAGGFGWRKLIRLNAKAGSQAEQSGIERLLFLQNIFEKTVAGDPFNVDQNVSKFNQAIVTRKQGPFSAAQRAAYFLTYSQLVKVNKENLPIKDASGNFQEDGKISVSLQATFDEGDRDPETGVTPREYFVPQSCQQCHGGSSVRPKANFLDTDHWIDRVTPDYGLTDAMFQQEDFTALAASPHDVIFDARKDPSRLTSAFTVVRQLNEEIRDQNASVGDINNFQLNAVNRWLDLHGPERFGTSHAPPYERGFGDQPWDPANETDRKVIYFLNRYCYRCHSSVRYNVFDKGAVLALAQRGAIQERVLNIDAADFWMPQDRTIPGLAVDPLTGEPKPTGDLKVFLDLVDQLIAP